MSLNPEVQMFAEITRLGRTLARNRTLDGLDDKNHKLLQQLLLTRWTVHMDEPHRWIITEPLTRLKPQQLTFDSVHGAINIAKVKLV